MRRARQLRDAEKDELVRRYLEVRNMRQVAREFGMSRTTVAKLLAERDIDTSRGMKPAEVKQAIRMYEEGLSSITIGKQLGFDNPTVLKLLRRAGVKIRASAVRRGTSNEDEESDSDEIGPAWREWSSPRRIRQ
jgi:DNA-directed RNA polymerase specialized sigma24 family protein